METWILFALTTAILISISTLIEKKTLFKEHAMEFCAVLSVLTLIVSLPLFLLIDYSKLQLIPILVLFFNAALASIAYLFTIKTIRHMDLSDSTPLFALGPALSALLAFIFLGEILTKYQIIGIIIMLSGVYILETRSMKNILKPILTLKKSKYFYYILISLLIYAITAVFDRLILFKFDMQPEAYIAIAQIFIAIDFIVMMFLFHDGMKGIKHGLKMSGRWIFLVAILTLGYRLAQAEAIKLANVGLVLSVKRVSALFIVIIGGELFKEKNLAKKIIATLIILIGLVFIVI